MKKKLGIVLSGGGAKGAYEVGFLKALAEFDIQPDAIAGTSIGALNGAIYSAKKDTKVTAKLLNTLWEELSKDNPLEFKNATKTIIDVFILFALTGNVTKLGKILQGAISTEGVLTQVPLINRLEKYASPKNLIDGLPFYIGLTKSKGHLIDFKNFLGLGNEKTVFKKIQDLKKEEMHKAIMASASLPILFDSLEVEGVKYADGCLSSTDNEWGNMPAKPLIEIEKCTHLIVCHLNEGSFFDRHDPLFKDTTIMEIRPEAGTFKSSIDPLMFKVENIGKWIDQGYMDTKRIVGESLQALEAIEGRRAAETLSDDAVNKLRRREFKLS
jgi:NTE family protein